MFAFKCVLFCSLLALPCHSFFQPSPIRKLPTSIKPMAFTSSLSLAPVDFLSTIIADVADVITDAADVITDAADVITGAANVIPDASDAISDVVSSTAAATPPVEASAFVPIKPSYSKWSYYTTLGVYILSFPGIYSQVTRSTKAKLKKKTYVSPGQNSDEEGAKDQRQQAGEIMAYMTANNYEVSENRGEVIVFKGLVQKSTSQAFFLVFITAASMASLALVLSIGFIDFTIPIIGGTVNWYYLVLFSPYAGLYYWNSGDRTDEIQIKLSSNDDESENEIYVIGNDDELTRMWQTLNLLEKGMVKIEGIMDV